MQLVRLFHCDEATESQQRLFLSMIQRGGEESGYYHLRTLKFSNTFYGKFSTAAYFGGVKPAK